MGAKIALPYLLVATLWILLSDALVTAAAPTPQSAQWLQTWKGWIYVLVTAGLLYALVTRYARRVLTLMEDVCASERRFRRTIEMVPDIIYRACPADLSRSFMNARATVLGFSIEELDADPSLWNRQIHDDDRERVTAAIRRQLGHGMRFAVEYRAWHKDGATLRWFKDRGVLVEQENGNDAVITGVIEDITELRAAERQIAYLSNHDPLTGLINQRGLLLVLETKLRLARRDAREVSCLCLGIDNFHRLNSVYGRLAGDAVLARVAEALQRVLRARDTAGAVSDATLARTESDRFLIALPDTNLRAARAAGQRLISELGRFSTELQGQAIPVHLRIGVATFPDHARDAGGLVSHAEFALERARERGRASIHVLDPREQQTEGQALRQVQDIHSALEHDRFAVHFQPILHIASRRVHHFEALARMRDGAGDTVPTGQFIEVAERFGLIDQIDERVLELVLTHLREVKRQGACTSVAVNLSGAHIDSPAFLKRLRARLAQTGVPAEWLIFEITETAAIQNPSRAKLFMEQVTAMGARFALDDFGVGFTSFAHLRSLPIHYIKIDGSFIRNLHASPDDQALVRAMTEVAKVHGKAVVAEFVENEVVLSVLDRLGVHYAQGFHIGRPQSLAPGQLAQSQPSRRRAWA